MKNSVIFMLVILGLMFCSTCLATTEDSWPIITSANGARYAADRFIVTTRQNVAPLLVENTIDGVAVTGVLSIDALCARYNVT